MKLKKRIASICFILGFGLLSFIFLTISLTAIGLLVGITATAVWPVVSLLAATALSWYLLRTQGLQKPWLWVWAAAVPVLIFVAVAVASVTIDASWDGNSYHKTAIGELANGWNPMRQDVNTFNASPANHFKIIGVEGTSRSFDTPWIDHYPKGSWFFAADIYRLTGNIESGKALAPLAVFALFLFALGYLYQKFDRNKAILLSALLAITPIIAVQLYSYYVDGIMGNLLIMLLVACTIVLDADKKLAVPNRRLLVYGTIFMTLVLTINMKFTGLAYGVIILGCYGLFWAAKRNWALVIRLAVVGAAAGVFAVLVVGATSYVKNFQTHHNPLYPLVGTGSIDFITPQEPISYEHKPRLVKFIYANLSPTGIENRETSLQHGSPKPKIPFSASLEEISLLHGVDIKQGAYGVWFGGILLVSCAMGAYALIRYGRRYAAQLPLFLIPLAALGITILGVDATWWARYLPYLPIFPIIVVAVLYLRKETVLPNILVFMMLFNVTLMTIMCLNNQSKVHPLTMQTFAQLKPCNGNTPIKVYSSIRLDGAFYNLHDKCKNVTPVTQQEFNATPKDHRVLIFNGMYVLRPS
jgi:hypothetical protein